MTKNKNSLSLSEKYLHIPYRKQSPVKLTNMLRVRNDYRLDTRALFSTLPTCFTALIFLNVGASVFSDKSLDTVLYDYCSNT